MSKILVTGDKGFIGKHLVNLLKQDANNDITGIDLKDNNDIRNYDFKGQKFDIIYHLAALRSVPKSFDNPRQYVSTNVYGTLRLIQAFPKARFINISSSSVKTLLSPYAYSKYWAEIIANEHSNNVNLRLFNVFGEGQTCDMLIPNIIRNLLDEVPTTIYGTGKQKRDFTYVKDVVKELVWYGERQISGTFEIGYGSPKSVLEIHDLISKFSGLEGYLVYADKRIGDYNYTKAKDKFHTKTIGLKQGLINTINWWEQCLIYP